MKLPRTEQEYTQFALEQAGETDSFYMRATWDHKIPKQQVRNWIKYTYVNFPELVSFKKEHEDLTYIRIAGVFIASFRGDSHEHDSVERVKENYGHKYAIAENS